MIKANELRIGNLLLFQDKINTINSHEIYLIEYEEHIASLYNEIPLTEEWFDKLIENDFEFVGFGTRIIYQSIKYPQIKYELSGDRLIVYFADNIINLKMYVHEWQNIHFALTNEELKIK